MPLTKSKVGWVEIYQQDVDEVENPILRLWDVEGKAWIGHRAISGLNDDEEWVFTWPNSYAAKGYTSLLCVDEDGNILIVDPTTYRTDPTTSHSLDPTYNDTQLEGALDALGLKIQEILDTLRDKYIILPHTETIIPDAASAKGITYGPIGIIPPPASAIGGTFFQLEIFVSARGDTKGPAVKIAGGTATVLVVPDPAEAGSETDWEEVIDYIDPAFVHAAASTVDPTVVIA